MEIIITEIDPISYYKYMRQARNRKYVSKEGREYRQSIEDIFTKYMVDNNLEMFEKGVNIKVEISFTFGNKRKNDLDNFTKVILDCCSDILFFDDCFITDLHIKKNYVKKTPKIIVKINKIEYVDISKV